MVASTVPNRGEPSKSDGSSPCRCTGPGSSPMVKVPCHVRVTVPSAVNAARPKDTMRDVFGWMPVVRATAATNGAPSAGEPASSASDSAGSSDPCAIYASAGAAVARLTAEVIAFSDA